MYNLLSYFFFLSTTLFLKNFKTVEDIALPERYFLCAVKNERTPATIIGLIDWNFSDTIRQWGAQRQLDDGRMKMRGIIFVFLRRFRFYNPILHEQRCVEHDDVHLMKLVDRFPALHNATSSGTNSVGKN